MVKVDNHEVQIGDWVCFKSDIEQSGQVVEIKKSYMGPSLTLENKRGFDGEYIGGWYITTVLASECWIE